MRVQRTALVVTAAVVVVCLGLAAAVACAQQIATGLAHTCIVTPTGNTTLIDGGSVTCWYDNGAQPQGTPPAGLADVVVLRAGMSHTCALSSRGVLTCWGDNTYGQLNLPTNQPYRDVACGQSFTCALLLESGQAVCAGIDSWGLAIAGTAPNGTAFDRLAQGGWDGMCGLWLPTGNATDDARVPVCWPDQVEGARADQPTAPMLEYAMAQSVSVGLRTTDLTVTLAGGGSASWAFDLVPAGTFSTITACWRTACGLQSPSQFITCWGSESSPVVPPYAFAQISVGWEHGCGVTTSGRTMCWLSPAAATKFVSVAGRAPSAVFKLGGALVGSPIGVTFMSACGILAATAATPTEQVACWGSYDPTTLNAHFNAADIIGFGTGSDTARMLIQVANGTAWWVDGAARTVTPFGLGAAFVHGYVYGGACECGQRADAPGLVTCVRANTGQPFVWLGTGGQLWTSVRCSLEVCCAVVYAAGAPYGTIVCITSAGTSYLSPSYQAVTVDVGGFANPCALIYPTYSVTCWYLGTTTPLMSAGGPFSMVISTQYGVFCGILVADGTVKCLPDPSYAPPGGPYVWLVSGERFVCGMATTGQIYCGGGNRYGELDVPSLPVGALAPQHFYRAGIHIRPCPFGSWSSGPGAVNPLCSGPCNAGTVPIPQATTPECGGPCPTGHYCPFRTNSSLPCPAGTFNSVTGSTDKSACVACQPGYWCAAGQSAPNLNPCRAGFYGSRSGATDDTCDGPCPAGYWCPEASTQPTRLLCGAESLYCPLNSSQPLAAPPGTFTIPRNESLAARRVAVSDCPTGYACNGGILSACSAVGTYTNASGASMCSTCPDGWTTGPATSNGVFTSCVQCGAGSAGVNGVCNLCPAGRAAAGPTSTACGVCDVGQYSAAGAPKCTDCARGSYQSAPNSAGCTLCPVGAVNNVTGATACEACVAGRYSSAAGNQECLECDQGRYVDRSGAGYCTECPAPNVVSHHHLNCTLGGCSGGQYPVQLQHGNIRCTACDVGKYAAANSPQCSTCPTNTYAPFNGSVECFDCSDAPGVDCRGGVMTVAAGFWPWFGGASNDDDDDDGADAGAALDVAICPAGDYCSGTDPNPPYTFRCGTNRDQSDTNALCGRCADGFAEQSGHCIDCSGSGFGGYLFVALLLCEAIVLVLLWSAQRDGAVVSVALFFIQTALLIAGPEHAWLQWLQFINLSPSKVWLNACYLPLSPFHAYVFALFAPALFFGLLGATALAHRLLCATKTDCECRCGRGVCRRPRKVVPPFAGWIYIRGALALALAAYSTVSLNAMEYLQCITIGPYRVVAARPAISCDSAQYKQLLPFVIVVPLLGVVVGWPVAALVFLCRRRSAVRHNNGGETATTEFGRRWGVLYAPYSAQSFFWTAVVLTRRTLYTAANLLGSVAALAPARILCFQLLAIASLLLQLVVQPFAAAAPNRFETASHALLTVLSVLLGAYGATPGHAMPTATQVLTGLLVLVPTLVFIAVILYDLVRRYCACCGGDAKALDALESVPPSPAVSQQPLQHAHDELAHELLAVAEPSHSRLSSDSGYDGRATPLLAAASAAAAAAAAAKL